MHKLGIRLWNSIWEKSVKNGADCNKIQAKHLIQAFSSTSKEPNTKVNKIVNFGEMVAKRRLQAQRSIIVQVNSEKSFPDLQKYCSNYGSIVGAHHYRVNEVHYILAEFSNKQEANKAIEDSTFNETTSGHVQSAFLWFRNVRNVAKVEKAGESGKLKTTNGCQSIDYSETNNLMSAAESVTDQMVILHKTTMLNDLGTRMRFIAARQVEQSMSGLFPHAEVHLFGSSVNGCGKLGCDLDLILRLNSKEPKCDPTKRLVFHTKQCLTSARVQVQRNLQNLSDTMHWLMPGIQNIRRIFQARVPIIRYNHEYLKLEVDLSMDNMSGFYMSQILYMFGQIDDRVSPLVFTIRRWAETQRLTNSSPGPWITNFSLTCLVMFYLQQMSQPVIPSINAFLTQPQQLPDKQSGDDDDDDDFKCIDLRDLNLLEFPKQNKDSLDELLVGFFEFYSQFDFKESSISLNDARILPKPDNSAVHIVNPLDPFLNVSKNVNAKECERFRMEARNAAWTLSSDNKSSPSEPWGLLNLFRNHQQPIIKPEFFFKSRMVEVTDLFQGSEDKSNDEFKNDEVKNEVKAIKRRGRIELNAIKTSAKKSWFEINSQWVSQWMLVGFIPMIFYGLHSIIFYGKPFENEAVLIIFLSTYGNLNSIPVLKVRFYMEIDDLVLSTLYTIVENDSKSLRAISSAEKIGLRM